MYNKKQCPYCFDGDAGWVVSRRGDDGEPEPLAYLDTETLADLLLTALLGRPSPLAASDARFRVGVWPEDTWLE